jgi:formylglycine-generating enzyme required for sulfatase activity
MPAQPSDDGRWVRAVQPLFWPGNVDSAKTKRSSEMIHRAWSRLESLRDDEHNEQAVRDKARRVLALFQGEFEQILAGQFGAERQRAARDFVDHFKNVEPPKPGTFRMGTPDEKQGWSEEVREDHRRWLERGRDNPEGHAKEYYSARPFLGKAGKILRERLEADLASVIRAQDLPELEDWWARHDETPAQDWSDRHIEAFQLNRYPTLNAWYRLFDPDHGTRADFYLSVYQRVSPTGEHPAVFVSWYDAWVFCRWAYWDGRECRLPHEDEWEYVAKAGTPWDRNRWWRDEDELLAKHCTFGQPYDQGGATAPRDCDPADAIYQAGKRKPERDHCNPWSFVDMLGNVWEWTADLYRVKYTRADPPTEYSARVLRGGSWFNRPDFVRSGVRRVYPPTYVYDHVGFRVARALP